MHAAHSRSRNPIRGWLRRSSQPFPQASGPWVSSWFAGEECGPVEDTVDSDARSIRQWRVRWPQHCVLERAAAAEKFLADRKSNALLSFEPQHGNIAIERVC